MTTMQKLIAAAVLGFVLIFGSLAYSTFRAPEQASAPIAAIPVASATAQPTTAASSAATSTAATDTAAAGTSDSTAATGSAIVAQIVQGESEARFVIDEVLNNAPFTVVGTTDQVAGQIVVDPQDPGQTQVGTIQVNARTLATDSEFRDRAIKNRILSTDQYEMITFTPTEIVGLPENGTVGQSYSFQIVGDLTIRDVTRQVTFEVTATPTSETRLEGTAQTTIAYADWGITIPQVRQVASVSDEVRLEIDFVAVAQ
ncbi:MAG TPA: YceI family protein [Herpetosiphonaceae bacterium]